MRTTADLGNMVALAMHSPLHAGYTVEDMLRLFLPPLGLDQIVMLADGERPVAVATYAFLSDEAKADLLVRKRPMMPVDWNSGPHLHIVDVIAPWGHARQLVSILRSRFPGRSFSARRLYRDGRRRVVEGRNGG